MKFGKWVLGPAVASLWLMSAQAAPLPVVHNPAGMTQALERVQFYNGPRYERYDERYDNRRRDRYDGRRSDRYDGRARSRYDDRRARRDYGESRGRAYGAPGPAYRGGPPARGGVVPLPRRRVSPPNVYTKEQVRDWNRRNGL